MRERVKEAEGERVDGWGEGSGTNKPRGTNLGARQHFIRGAGAHARRARARTRESRGRAGRDPERRPWAKMSARQIGDANRSHPPSLPPAAAALSWSPMRPHQADLIRQPRRPPGTTSSPSRLFHRTDSPPLPQPPPPPSPRTPQPQCPARRPPRTSRPAFFPARPFLRARTHACLSFSEPRQFVEPRRSRSPSAG